MVTRTVETDSFKFYYTKIAEEFSLITIDKETRKEVEFVGSLKDCKEFQEMVLESGI